MPLRKSRRRYPFATAGGEAALQVEDKERFFRESSFRLRDRRGVNPVRPVLDNCCFFQAKADFVYDPHVHAAYELIVSDDRPYACFLNGGHLTMPAGKLLLVQPGDTHQGILECGQTLFVATFLIEFDSPGGEPATLFRKNAPLAGRILDPETIAHAPELCRLLREAGRDESPRSGFVLGGIFSALFWTLLPAWPEAILDPAFLRETVQETFRDNLFRLFRKHVHDGIRVADLAAEMRMTPRSLERKCREVLHLPPGAAFLDFKLRDLAKLVAGSELSMKEIAARYGFENQFHFSRLFKRRFGTSPTEYRRRNRR